MKPPSSLRYTLYYGHGLPDLLPPCDLAVLAPEGWLPRDRHALRTRGTRLLGYLSVLEVPTDDQGPPPGTLIIDGRPLRNKVWSTYVLDPRHPATAHRLLTQARLLRKEGWDGLFLDTVTQAESPTLPAPLRGPLVATTAVLIAQLAADWPKGMLIQNWGFGPLLPLTAPYLSGLCWEDFPYQSLAECRQGEMLDLAGRLSAWSARANLQILALNEACSDPDLATQVAMKWGFSWYGAPGAYTLPPTPR